MKNRRRGHNEGSITQRRDGRWEGRIDLGWQDGQRQRKSVYGATRAEANKKLTAALADKGKGLPPVPERETVGRFFTQWLEQSARATLRPRTYESYEGIYRLHIAPDLQKVPLVRLTPQMVQELLDRRAAAGLGAQTVHHIRTVLRRVLNRALRLNYSVAMSLGMRKGEILGLRWSDVDLDSQTLHVQQAIQRVSKRVTGDNRGALRITETKTPRSRRTLALPEIAVKALKAQRVRQLEARLAAGAAWKDTGLVFTTALGTAIEPRNLIRHFKKALGEAELRDVRFHDLRHSAASLLLAQGVPLRSIMELLGHSSIGVTADIYAHIAPAMMRETATKMDAALGE